MSNRPLSNASLTTSLRERLTLDEAKGEYRDGSIRYLIMRPDVLMGMFAVLPTERREEALEALAQSALAFGGRSVKAYRDAGANDANELLRVIAETSSQLGWGRWTFSDGEDGRSLQLAIRNSPFAAGFGKSKTPVCHAVRGIFSALAPVVFGEQISVEETSCAAQGDSDSCHFLMRLS